MMSSERIENSGIIYYYNENDQLHREDGPAVIYPDGTEMWYKNDQLHREDGPAAIFPDGEEYWCSDGEKYIEKMVLL